MGSHFFEALDRVTQDILVDKMEKRRWGRTLLSGFVTGRTRTFKVLINRVMSTGEETQPCAVGAAFGPVLLSKLTGGLNRIVGGSC